VLAVLWACYSSRPWVSGLLVGVAAGIKLTPAVSALYFLGARRWSAVAASAVVFIGTVALSVVVLGAQGRYYFTDLLGNAGRIGPVASPMNQSLRGMVGYLLGHDTGYGALVLLGIGVAAVLTVLAWRAIDSDDALGRLLVVMLFGLLISPISWTHHYVWLLPLILWLLYGPTRGRTRNVGWAWFALGYVSPPWILVFTDSRGWTVSSHSYLAWVGSLYVLATLATLAYLATLRRRSDRAARPCSDPSV
jgi:alpha-1,2-mannosyltransferase